MGVERVTGLAASCTLVRVRRRQARDARLVDRHRIRVCMGHMQHGQKRRTGRQGARLCGIIITLQIDDRPVSTGPESFAAQHTPRLNGTLGT